MPASRPATCSTCNRAALRRDLPRASASCSSPTVRRVRTPPDAGRSPGAARLLLLGTTGGQPVDGGAGHGNHPVLGPPQLAAPGEPGPFSPSSPELIRDVLGVAGWSDITVGELTIEQPHPAGDADAVAYVVVEFSPPSSRASSALRSAAAQPGRRSPKHSVLSNGTVSFTSGPAPSSSPRKPERRQPHCPVTLSSDPHASARRPIRASVCGSAPGIIDERTVATSVAGDIWCPLG